LYRLVRADPFAAGRKINFSAAWIIEQNGLRL
jgi:hypothetical protein